MPPDGASYHLNVPLMPFKLFAVNVTGPGAEPVAQREPGTTSGGIETGFKVAVTAARLLTHPLLSTLT